jgi:hypothetical protein
LLCRKASNNALEPQSTPILDFAEQPHRLKEDSQPIVELVVGVREDLSEEVERKGKQSLQQGSVEAEEESGPL